MGGDGKTSGTAQTTKAYVVVVERGTLGLFETLTEHLGEPEMVEVIWDRRVGERRKPSLPRRGDRRRSDRRGGAPASWNSFGFLLTVRGGETGPTPPTGWEPGRKKS